MRLMRSTIDKLYSQEDKPGVIAADGSTRWYKNNVLHRGGDRPAYITADGSMFWYQNGLLHRDDDQPAYISADGLCMSWYRYGLLHRDDDMPAYVDRRRVSEWYRRGMLHREWDQPARVFSDGTESYYQFGFRHRENGLPALILASGHVEYHEFGELHREDGPAVIYEDGNEAWYLNGVEVEVAEEEEDSEYEEYYSSVDEKVDVFNADEVLDGFTSFTDSNQECGVCMDASEDSLVETDCKHKFHRHCLSRWFIRKNTCPMCRHEY
jgi:hypothetical protein